MFENDLFLENDDFSINVQVGPNDEYDMTTDDVEYDGGDEGYEMEDDMNPIKRVKADPNTIPITKCEDMYYSSCKDIAKCADYSGKSIPSVIKDVCECNSINKKDLLVVMTEDTLMYTALVESCDVETIYFESISFHNPPGDAEKGIDEHGEYDDRIGNEYCDDDDEYDDDDYEEDPCVEKCGENCCKSVKDECGVPVQTMTIPDNPADANPCMAAKCDNYEDVIIAKDTNDKYYIDKDDVEDVAKSNDITFEEAVERILEANNIDPEVEDIIIL